MANYNNRTKAFFKSVKLPKQYTPENRGLDECCCSFMVFASDSTDSWKNQKTSAWIPKADFIEFELIKSDGTIIPQTAIEFPNQLDAYYCTVDWYTILADHGSDCYELKVTYTVAGVSDFFTWGKYDLIPYNLKRLNGWVALQTTFDSNQTIEGINFAGANVVDCINFHGWFGERKTNTVVENLIYSTREARKVYRENLNSYELKADSVMECISNKLLDLHLLSENNLLVSDFNAYNHTYKYLSFPVIVEESPNVTYKTRKATITCKVGDKFKNSRSKYGLQ